MSATPRKIFLRNGAGEVEGPLDVSQLKGKPTDGLELSVDGSPFASASLYPELAEALGKAVLPQAAPLAGPGAKAFAAKSGYAGDFSNADVVRKSAPPPSAAPLSLDKLNGPPAEGDLTQLSPLQLYYLGASTSVTGRLNLVLADRTVELWFKKGEPVLVQSSHPDDSVGEYLIAQSQLSEESLARAEAEKARFGGELVGTLFALGILSPGIGFSMLAQHATLLLQHALLAHQGRFTFAARELPAQRAIPLGNRWALVLEAVRRLPVVELRRRLERLSDHPVMKSGGKVPLSELRFSPKETRTFGYFDGVRSLSHLLNDFPAEQDSVIRLVYLGKEFQLVSFAAVKIPPPAPPDAPAGAPAAPAAPSGVPPARPAAVGPGKAPSTAAADSSQPVSAAPSPSGSPSPAPATTQTAPNGAAGPARPAAQPASAAASPGGTGAATPQARPPGGGPPVLKPVAASAPARPSAPAGAATPQSAPAVDLAALRTQADEFRKKNLFEVLGVADKAEGAAIKAAYFSLAKQFHPDTVPSGAPPEMAKLKAEIFARIGEAYRTLSDEKARADYVDGLLHGGGEGVDVAQLLQAEETFQKATFFIKARKFQGALPLLDEAIGINPDEGEFYAWRGYARFMAAPDKRAVQGEAEQDLRTALQKTPKCAPAHYFLGQVYKTLGDSRRALESFKRALEIQPDHIDAQREIRLLGKK